MKGYTRTTVYEICLVILSKLFVVNGLMGSVCIVEGENTCCINHFNNNGTCEECPIGYEAPDGVKCKICPSGFYGRNCADQCFCDKNKICHHIEGCIEPPITQPSQESPDENNENKEHNDQTVMITSLVIAAASLAIVIMIVTIRCATKLRVEAGNLMKIHCKQDKEMQQERKTNIYGSYHAKKMNTDDDEDEYEFDSDDEEEEEDEYAVIRESQMISTIVPMEDEDMSAVCELSDGGPGLYNTTMYNHLFGQGETCTSIIQEEYGSGLPPTNYTKKFVTFQDD